MDDYSEVNEFFDNDLSGPDGGNSDDEVLNKLLEKENQEVMKKRTKSRPQPRLNEATITGEKGIQALQDSLKGFKPDPSQNPYDNLAAMLKKYEHWAHVMFPKLKFEDVVSRCEFLGDKRPVKVYMMKSRLGMPLADDDFAPARRRKGDEIIDTENNEDSADRFNGRSDSDENDENYYDPLESANPLARFEHTDAAKKPPPSTAEASRRSPPPQQYDEDLMASAMETRTKALEEEQRQREEEELALANEIMEDLDMY